MPYIDNFCVLSQMPVRYDGVAFLSFPRAAYIFCPRYADGVIQACSSFGVKKVIPAVNFINVRTFRPYGIIQRSAPDAYAFACKRVFTGRKKGKVYFLYINFIIARIRFALRRGMGAAVPDFSVVVKKN